MSQKPYRFDGKLDYLEMTRRLDWINDKYNPDDLAEYSEFQKPYLRDDNTYADWELGFPDLDFPDLPEWWGGFEGGDPEGNPCSIDEDCVWAGIIGPPTLDCGKCYTYSQAHVFLGCEVAPWWAAFGSWTLTGGDGECFLLFSGPIMATVCCSDSAGEQQLELCYESPLNCQGCIGITVPEGCDCCEEFTLTGDATVNDNATWTGTIDPPCPNAECSVASNSGCTGFTCEVNEAGSEVAVGVPDDACGTFTVTVQDQNYGGDCISIDSAAVRINNTGGSQPPVTWQNIATCDLDSEETCGVAGYSCRNGVTINGNCISGEFKYVYSYECCWTNKAGQPCGSDCGTCPPQVCECPPCASCTGLCFATCSCYGTGASWKSVHKQEWKCEC